MVAVIRLVLAQCLLVALIAGCAQGSPSELFGRQAAGAVEPPAADTRALTADEYRMGVGDIISVRVYGGEEEVRLEKVRLDNSGNVTLPFGHFKVLGQTTREVETAIMKTVKGRILKDPKVWVSIDEYRPFYVDGQVGRPGAYPYQPGLNVRRAVTIAGGFRERASLAKMFVIRENDKAGRPLKVDLNSPVAPGDTITVPEGMF